MGKHHTHYAPGARGRVPDRAWFWMAWTVWLILWVGLTAALLAVMG